MARMHLVEGPVGAGKSTFAASLRARHDAPHLALDAWMATLFGPDRPATGWVDWYLERKDRCLEQIWAVTRQVLESGGDVVLELGLVQRRSRESLYSRVDAEAYEMTVYVLDAPREVRRERVLVSKLYSLAWSESTWQGYEAAFRRLVSMVDGVERQAVPWPDWAITTVIDTQSVWSTVWQAISCHESQVTAYEKLKDLSPEDHEALWGKQSFYRVFSTVNGGRVRETDLLEGIRAALISRPR